MAPTSVAKVIRPARRQKMGSSALSGTSSAHLRGGGVDFTPKGRDEAVVDKASARPGFGDVVARV